MKWVKSFLSHFFTPSFILGSGIAGSTGFLWYKHAVDDQVACTIFVVTLPFIIGGKKSGKEIGEEVKRNLILIHLIRLLLRELR